MNGRIVAIFCAGVTGFLVAGPLRASEEGGSEESVALSGSALLEQANALRDEQFEVAGRVSKDFPDSADALVLMGYVYSSHGMLAETAKCWERCLALDPKRADIYDQMGRLAVRREDYEEALGLWRKALKLQGAMPGAHHGMAEALMAMGRTEEAVAELHRELEISPGSSASHYALGQAYARLQEFEKAKASYLAAVRVQPDHLRAYYGLATVCARLGQREESANYREEFRKLKVLGVEANNDTRSQYDDLERMRVKLAVTCTDAGRVYQRHGYIWRAEKLWRRAAELDSKNVVCRTLLAGVYEQGRRPEDALRMYGELAGIDPSNVGYHQKMGLLSAGLKRFDAAERAFKKMVEVAPQRGEGYRMLAQLYLNLDRDLSGAKELAATSVRLEPIAPSYFVMAWAHVKNGERAAALAAIRKAVDLDPGNTQYRKMYESIQKEN
ncbi:MAG: hypothetical protein A2V70_00745 [Planctomycetes bacterium RBG_13_63_9]|nr:MAG: hypothetical protein A2V70_00745 [Planctomycetes bacterium RBG_13_63_9]